MKTTNNNCHTKLFVFFALSVAVSGCTTRTAPPAAMARYLSADSVDIRKVLSAPPADNSALTRSEVEIILALQAGRTPADVAHLNAEGAFSPDLLTEVLGEPFKNNSPPATTALLKYVSADAKCVISSAKSCWKRSRPWVVDARMMQERGG